MNDVRSKVLSIVQINGPILPVKISKVINQNILFTSAILSELTDRKEILLSKAKIGGSPVYYIKGQEERLKMLYEHLKDVHKKVYDLLNEKKMLKDSECEPWERVALREIGDFAKQFNYNNEVFWRWHLTSEEEAKQLLSPEQKTEELQENPINIKEIQENPINAENIKEEVTQLKLEEPKQKLKKQKIKVSKIKDDSRILSTINNYFNENDIKILNEMQNAFKENRVLQNYIKKNKIDRVIEIEFKTGLKIEILVDVKSGHIKSYYPSHNNL